MDDRSRLLGEKAFEALTRLVRERLSRKAGAHLVQGSLDRIVLRVGLVLKGPAAGAPAFTDALVTDVDRLIEEAIQHAAAFRPGHAYCYRCGGAPCEHAVAPSHRHVFAGYAPTGVPRWEDFAQLCLDRKHPDVDRLFEDRPALVTFVSEGAELNAHLLDAFRGNASFRLRAQVAAGFFPVRTRDGEGRGVVAVTFQAGASEGRRGRTRHGLNVLGRTPQGGPLDLLWERHDVIPWQAAVSWAQSALKTADGDARVGAIMRGLARRLLHERRARAGRTGHADLRHRDGARPTRAALADLARARPEDVLVDERHGTLVVPGERGRMHFYTGDGKLVTSVRYTPDAISKKLGLGLWRPSRREESEPLLKRGQQPK
jgi:hypothetical protein